MSEAEKRAVKKTGAVLGKITEQGFTHSPKHRFLKTLRNPAVNIKTYGASALFPLLLKDEIPSLTLGKPPAEILLSSAAAGWAYQPPVKQAPCRRARHFSSGFWAVDSAITDKTAGGALKSIGENRGLVMTRLKGLPPPSPARESFILTDSTHAMSASEHPEADAEGCSGSFDFGKQVRLTQLFSAKMKLPVQYRLLGGNTADAAAVDLCVRGMGVCGAVSIADKGCCGGENAAVLEQRNLKQLMPVRRNNPAVDYGPIGGGGVKSKGRRFTWQGGVIWYQRYEASGLRFTACLDGRLRVEEAQDYLTRIRTHPDGYTEAGYWEKPRCFGALTLTYRMSGTPAPDEVSTAYKQRNEVEMMFDRYTAFMKADVSSM